MKKKIIKKKKQKTGPVRILTERMILLSCRQALKDFKNGKLVRV